MMAVGLSVFLAVLTAPASADQPMVLTNVVTFVDENPCTGLDHTITIFLNAFIHDHNNNFVVHVERTGITDSGYTMFNGHAQFVDNSHVIVNTFKDLWRSEDDGSMFEAAFTMIVNLNQGEIKVQEGAIRCIHT